MQVKKIRHTGLVVKDMEKSLAFYRDFLGFQQVSDNLEAGSFVGKILGTPGISVRTCKLKTSSDEILELLFFQKPFRGVERYPRLNDFGFTHIAMTLDNIKEFFQKSKNTFQCGKLSEPQLSTDGKVLVCFITGPDGEWIELVEEINRNG